MVQPKWKTFEEQVRGIAALIFGQPCQPGRIAGVNFDGVIKRGDLETIRCRDQRAERSRQSQTSITRLTLARQTLSADGVLLRGYIVLNRAPTQALVEAATAAKLTVGSAGQFASLFFQFPIYKNARIAASFGSSIDPLTGDVDNVSYVPVMYERLDGGKELSIADLAEMLLSGRT